MFFANPHLLWLLAVFPPALVVFFWWSWRQRQELMTRFIQSRLLPALVSGVSAGRQKLRAGLVIAAVACLLVALAQPKWGFRYEAVNQRGVDIVVAVDTSKSMLAQDIAPNRLARAKLAALELMQLATADRLGLVAFAGNAFLECPLTIDDVAFRQAVDALDVNTIPQGGTALAEAIDTALSTFKEGDNHKVLVLLTDGEDHDSGAIEAAKKAAAAGLRIYTIGIGTSAGELLPIKGADGHPDFVRDEQGNVVKSHLNENLLREIAATTGGFYLPLRGAKTMDTLYEHPQGLASLPKSEHEERLVPQFYDRYRWPLAVAIALLFAETLLPERKRERKERRLSGVTAAHSKPLAILGAICGLLSLSLWSASGSPATALREYQAGKYQEALKEYERLLEHNTDDPRLHFNAGTAAYSSRQFEEAAKQFNAARTASDLKLQERAYYNHGNSLFRLGEQKPDPKQKSEAWEQAVQDYELSVRLEPQDADAKFNLEFVKKKLEELKQQQKKNEPQKNIEPSEDAKRAKAAADRAVQQRDYAGALEIMQKQLAVDPTTAYYGDYIQRLKDVNGVQETPQH